MDGGRGSGGGHGDSGGDGTISVRPGGQGTTAVGTATSTPPNHHSHPSIGIVEDEDEDEEDDEEEDEEEEEGGERISNNRMSFRTIVEAVVDSNERGGANNTGLRIGLQHNDFPRSHCNDGRTGSQGQILRAWEEASTGKATPPAGAVTAGRRERGGGRAGGSTAHVGGGSDSSEESRNSYYPYDQSQLEVRARAGLSTVESALFVVQLETPLPGTVIFEQVFPRPISHFSFTLSGPRGTAMCPAFPRPKYLAYLPAHH